MWRNWNVHMLQVRIYNGAALAPQELVLSPWRMLSCMSLDGEGVKV